MPEIVPEQSVVEVSFPQQVTVDQTTVNPEVPEERLLPAVAGEQGQVLTVGEAGPEWAEASAEVPEERLLPTGGEAGEVVTRDGEGAAVWAPPTGGGGPVESPAGWGWGAPQVLAVDGSTTVVTLDDGLPACRWFQHPRTGGEDRAVIDATALHGCPGVPILISEKVDRETRQTRSHGPSLYYRVDVPGFLGDLAAVAGLGSLDFSGENAQTIGWSVNGAPVVSVLDSDYGDLGTFAGALLGPLFSAGVTQVNVPNVLHGDGSWFAALRTGEVGDGAAIEVTDPGSGDLAAILTSLVSIPGETGYPAGVNFTGTGTGDEGWQSTTHLWTDDAADPYHHLFVVWSDGDDLFAQRTMQLPEMPFSPVADSDWERPEDGYNAATALDELAARVAQLEAAQGGG